MTALAPLLEGFFTDRLAALRVSPHTVAAYRDSLRLLLIFIQQQTGVQPSRLELTALNVDVIRAFLDHLEVDRGNGPVTRNLRLTAIHSLFHYAALRCPEHAELIQRVLATPMKRTDIPLITFLTRIEADALTAAPDRSTALGRRDHLLLTVGIQTGLRVSELTAVTRDDVEVGVGAHVRCVGKGRKERATPLTRSTARLLDEWFRNRQLPGNGSVFATTAGRPLSSDAVQRLITKHAAAASRRCPSLASKTVTPHVLRHTCAMNLLQAGVDPASIALWLGHASTKATDIYLHADLAMKDKALALIAPTEAAARRYQPSDKLLAFLEGL